jgi:hypothetical protein
METKVEFLLKLINQKRDKANHIENLCLPANGLKFYHQGRKSAFDESKKLIEHILNSENS